MIWEGPNRVRLGLEITETITNRPSRDHCANDGLESVRTCRSRMIRGGELCSKPGRLNSSTSTHTFV